MAGGRARRHILPLWVIGIGLVLLALTNDLHGMMLHIRYDAQEEISSPGPLYYIIIAWHIILFLTAFFIVLYRCRVYAARRRWWLPLLVVLPGIILWGIYYANGGTSPQLHGIAFYNIQEVHLWIFLGLWESCILIGLIPSASLAREREWIREGILRTVSQEYTELKRRIARLWREEGTALREDLVRMGCMGVYMKRRANLELIADERGYLNTRELSLAVKETFVYYQLAGVTTGYEETGNVAVPAVAVLAAYEIFKEILEQSGCMTCYVKVQASRTDVYTGFKMLIEVDRAQSDEGTPVREARAKEARIKLSVREQDETFVWELEAMYPEKSGRPGRLRFPEKLPAHGLSGLVGFLALEQEALAAKIRIHDCLGSCLLMTKRYLTTTGQVSKDALFLEWSRALALLDGQKLMAEASDEGGKRGEAISDAADYAVCLRQAEALGIDVKFSGSMPGDSELMQIIDMAITVHITNIVKHTTGKTAKICSEWYETPEGGARYILTLTNDGETVGGEKQETGGLKNLRTLAEGYGGEMEVVWKPAFCMRLSFQVI